MIIFCNIFLKILFVIVNSDAVEDMKATGIYPNSDLIPDLYNIYMEAVAKDEDKMTRRLFKDRKLYTIHIEKLKDVNGIKSHNLIVTDDTFQAKNPIVYINNPVESHLPYAYLTEEQFKNDMLKKLMQQREEFEKQKLSKYINKFKLFNHNAKRVHAVITKTAMPRAKHVDLSDLSRKRKANRTEKVNKHKNTVKKHKNHQMTTAKTVPTDAEDAYTEFVTDQNETTDAKISIINRITTVNATATTLPANTIVPSTAKENNLTEDTTKINTERTITEASTINIISKISTEVVMTTEVPFIDTEAEETTVTTTKLTTRKKQGRPYVFIGQ